MQAHSIRFPRASGALAAAVLLALGFETPVQAGGLPATTLATGGFHTCAIMRGALDCWGENTLGQIGNGTTERAIRPVPVIGLDRQVTIVAAGIYHTCALMNGSAYCWGDNHAGQLGIGSTQPADEPALISGLVATDIKAGGFNTCAIESGVLECWGDNGRGQVGNGTVGGNVLAPADVAGIGGASSFALGRTHVCAVSNGALYCWGDNSRGQLGLGAADDDPHTAPELVPGFETGAVMVAAGILHTCAVNQSAVLYCWGANDKGQVGDNTLTDRASPVAIIGSGVTAVTAGPLGQFGSPEFGSSTCAIADGSIRCWGYNAFGELGNGTLEDSLVPVDGPDLPGAIAVSSGGSHACAQFIDGRVSCWGDDSSGQLGDGARLDVMIPTPSPLLADLGGLSGGRAHGCGLDGAGTAICWGANETGQLGRGFETLAELPGPVNFIGAITAEVIAAGSSHSCAITDSANSVHCWGANGHGQLGNGNNEASPQPVEVQSIGGSVADVAASSDHSCAVLQSGNVRCWGRGDSGQLGNFSLSDSSVPVTVVRFDGLNNLPLSPANAVRVGHAHSCAVVDGSAMCWGANNEGQLGNASNVDSSRAVAVTGLTTGVEMLSTHYDHSCALVVGSAVDHGVRCWGANGAGQLGGGSAGATTTPIQVRTSPQEFLDHVTALAVGREHSCALRTDGRVWCWGGNAHGQLGTGTSLSSSFALEVLLPAQAEIVELVAGDDYTCARSDEGTWCWGHALYGRLGNGSLGFSSAATPTDTLFHDDFNDD